MSVAMSPTKEEAGYVTPDVKFIRDVIKLSGTSAKKCFQCGTCTVVCNVSYASSSPESFPRKLMLWTQWGLKDQVLGSPEIWACHQCNDCSANCPRGAKAGDVLAALRTLAIERFSVPGFMSRAFREPAFLLPAFGIPALLVAILVFLFNGFTYPAGEVVYTHFIPDIYVEIAGAVVFGCAILACGLGLLRFWGALDRSEAARLTSEAFGVHPVAGGGPRGMEAAFVSVMGDLATHTDFRVCQAERSRWLGHLLLLYGAPLLLFATAVVAVYSLAVGEVNRPLSDPVKVVGNLGGLLVLVGAMLLAYNRLGAKPSSWGAAGYFDWLFIWVIILNVVTGILVQAARYADAPQVAYPLYLVHLAVVFASFVYAPYGKFAHSFYRLAALTFIRQGGSGNPYRLFVLLPAALAVAVGVVAAVVGLAVGAAWLVQGLSAEPSVFQNLSTIPLTLYLPVANVSVSLPAIVSVGFGVGVLSGMTGVGGGFLMTPLLMTMGVPAAPAVGTDNMQIAGTASSGALAHWRLGNVDVRLGLTILSGSLVGGTIGVQIVAVLRAVGNFEFWVRIIYVLVLGTIGVLMLRESVRTWIRSIRLKLISSLVEEGFRELRPKLDSANDKAGTPFGRFAAGWPLQTDFKRAKVRSSVLFPFGMGLSVGTLAAVMGVGGGFIMVPSMIYILGVPTHVAVGTDLFQMVFTAANVGFQQAVTNHNVDVVLAVLLMVGAAFGAQVGSRMGHRLEGHQLRTLLGAVVVLVMIKMLLDIVLPPSSLIGVSTSGGGGH